jgi:hypothetical protein
MNEVKKGSNQLRHGVNQKPFSIYCDVPDSVIWADTDSYLHEYLNKKKSAYETTDYYVIVEGNVRTHLRKRL